MIEAGAARSPAPDAQAMPSGRPMDFVIGGVPRSGTTILSKILNGHELVYSYSSETNIFRHMWLYGRDAPLARSREAEFVSYLDRDMDIAFREHFKPYVESLKRYEGVLRRFNPKIPSRPILPLFGEDDIRGMRDEIIALMRSGLWGAPLFREASALMARWIRLRSGRDIVGEKTPDNIIAMPLISQATPQSLLVCTIRDPMPTIRSMMNRAQGGGVQDGAFSAEFIGSLGHYETYARAIYAAQQHTRRVHLVSYEGLMANPGPVVHELLQKLGLVADIDVRRIAVALIGQAPPRDDPHAGYSRSEVRLAKIVLGHLAGSLGIAGDLEVGEGRPYSAHRLFEAGRDARLVPVSGTEQTWAGMIPFAAAAAPVRCTASTTALIVAPRPVNRLSIDMHCVQQGSFVPPGAAQTTTISISHAPALDVELQGDGRTQTVEIDLQPFTATEVEPGSFVYAVHFETRLPGEVAGKAPALPVDVRLRSAV